jgi:hypothetical protein
MVVLYRVATITNTNSEETLVLKTQTHTKT